MKTYLIGEDVLRQVLDAIDQIVEVTLIEHPDHTKTVIAADIPRQLKESTETIRAILAKEPSAQVVSDLVPQDQTPAQRRAEGCLYCPKCFTFGHSHRKGCVFENDGMRNHVKDL